MRRFWREVAVEQAGDGWRVTLDGRPIKTQGGTPQVVPNAALAEALAREWRSQGDEIDPARFPFRDLADHALDNVADDRAGTIAKLLSFAEGDTLLYRAEPDEPLAHRQRELWEPWLKAAEAAHGVRFERISGIIHRPQPAATLAALRAVLESFDDLTLAALATLASLSASLVVALAALEPGADSEALWNVANLEEDWQAEQWGKDAEAMDRRARRLAIFSAAVRFGGLVRDGI
ncbi:MAG: ATP12 family protein [Novosphingobium sp.]